MYGCFESVGCKKATGVGLHVLPERIWSEMRSKNHSDTQNRQNRYCWTGRDGLVSSILNRSAQPYFANGEAQRVP